MTYTDKTINAEHQRRWYAKIKSENPELLRKYKERSRRYYYERGGQERNKQLKANKRKQWEQYLGNISCMRCGYNKCKRALSFHHIDPSQKSFGLNIVSFLNRRKIPIELLEKEIDKCVCLCLNCHHELEDGLWKLETYAA